MWSKWRFLAIFSSLKFFKFFYVVNIDNSDCFRASAKNRISKTIFSEEIFIHKGQILAENGKSGVQRSLYISRTVNGMKNLIRYSESTENFLSCTFHQIFAYSSSSGWKSGSKIGNFAKFSKILQNFENFFEKIFFFKISKWPNSQKSAIKKFSIFFPLWGHPGSSLRKFFDEKKIFSKIFFFQNF